VTGPGGPATPPTNAGGSIYDLGYQGYEGPRLGRGPVAFGLLRQSLRAAYGIGRGGRAKIAPFTLAAFALLPAVLVVGLSALASQAGAGEAFDEATPIRHDSYLGVTSTLIMLFCAAQAPELFGRDQRYNVLPLYFSRVLTRSDYALARTGGLLVAVFLVAIVPQIVLTIGAMLAAPDPLTGLSDEAADIPRYLAVSLLAAALLGSIAAAIAAWTPRRAYATAAIIAVFIIPPIIATVVYELGVGDLANLLLFASAADVLAGVNAAVFGGIPDSPVVAAADVDGWIYVVAAVLGTAAATALVLRRYRGVV
jgi:ABC-2 type transport system permease protein